MITFIQVRESAGRVERNFWIAGLQTLTRVFQIRVQPKAGTEGPSWKSMSPPSVPSDMPKIIGVVRRNYFSGKLFDSYRLSHND